MESNTKETFMSKMGNLFGIFFAVVMVFVIELIAISITQVMVINASNSDVSVDIKWGYNIIVSLLLSISYYLLVFKRRWLVKTKEYASSAAINPMTYLVITFIIIFVYYAIGINFGDKPMAGEAAMVFLTFFLFIFSLVYSTSDETYVSWFVVVLIWGLVIAITAAFAWSYKPDKTLAEVIDSKYLIIIGALWLIVTGMKKKAQILSPSSPGLAFIKGLKSKEGFGALCLISLFLLDLKMNSSARDLNEEPLIPDDWAASILAAFSALLVYYIYSNLDTFDYKTSEGFPNDVFNHALDTLQRFRAVDPEFVKQALVREQSLQAKLGLPEIDDCIPITELENMCEKVNNGDGFGNGTGFGSGFNLHPNARKLGLTQDNYDELKARNNLDDEQISIMIKSQDEKINKMFSEILADLRKPEKSKEEKIREQLELNKVVNGLFLPQKRSQEENAFIGYLTDKLGGRFPRQVYEDALLNKDEMEILAKEYSEFKKLTKNSKTNREDQKVTLASLFKKASDKTNKNNNRLKTVVNPSNQSTVDVSNVSGNPDRSSVSGVSQSILGDGERSSVSGVSQGISGDGERSSVSDDGGGSLGTSITNAAKTAGRKAVDGAKTVGGVAVGAAKAAGTGAKTAGRKAVDGAKTVGGVAVGAAKAAGTGAKNLGNAVLKTVSPKRKTVEDRHSGDQEPLLSDFGYDDDGQVPEPI